MIGKKTWIIPDMYYPEGGTRSPYVTHECISVLNLEKEDAQIRVTAYFEDRDPEVIGEFTCRSQRTVHYRLDKECSVGRNVPYSVLVESSAPIVAQYARVDTTQERLGLATTMAYPVD